jgi:hypothetical protein
LLELVVDKLTAMRILIRTNAPMSDAKSAIGRFRKMRTRSGRQGLCEGPGISFSAIIEEAAAVQI